MSSILFPGKREEKNTTYELEGAQYDEEILAQRLRDFAYGGGGGEEKNAKTKIKTYRMPRILRKSPPGVRKRNRSAGESEAGREEPDFNVASGGFCAEHEVVRSCTRQLHARKITKLFAAFLAPWP